MDAIPETSYLMMPPDTLQMVRKEINMEKPGEMKEAVRILDEWVKQQRFFVEKNISLHYLEMTIVGSKGSVERAKKHIMDMCTARSIRPQYFKTGELRESYEVFKEHYSVIAMPKLTSEYHRILILKIRGKIYNNILDAVYRYAYCCLDFLKMYDYHSGVVIILDLTETNLTHFVTHVNFFELGNCFLTCLNAYGMRLKRCHLVTPSKAIQNIIPLFKPFFTKKIMDRITVNDNTEELLDFYPKDSLPQDYGGNDKTIQELQAEILTVPQDELMQHMELMNKVQMDKSICMSPLNDEDSINGTFRSLNID